MRPTDPIRVVDVGDAVVGFGGSQSLADALDAEALLELAPDFRLQARSAHAPQRVLPVVRARRLVQQVAADLADVIPGRNAMTAHVLPELGGAEPASQHDRNAHVQGRRNDDHAAGAVIERQHVVEHVGAGQVQESRDHPAGVQEAQMTHQRGLGQPGGPGGEDVVERIAQAHRRAVAARRVRGARLRHGDIQRRCAGHHRGPGSVGVAHREPQRRQFIRPQARHAIAALGAEDQRPRRGLLERVLQDCDRALKY